MKLPGRNLRAYGARSAFLFAFAVLMAVATFGGSVLIHGIHRGLDTVEARLGADIVVTPSDAANEFNPQSFLIEAEPGYFYMDKSTVQKVGAIDGVKAVSGQIFLASARSSCCSGRYQVVAFDPSTDFVVQPWIADSVGQAQLGHMDVIVGANVSVYDTDNFALFGQRLHVVGKFDPTGSTLDNAVYMNFETAKKVIDSSLRKGLNKYSTLETDRIISSVMVKVAPGYDAEAVAAQIHQQVPGVAVATSTRMVSGIAQSLDSTSRTVAVLIGVAWGVGLLMITLLFVLMVAERRREFATLVAMGAHRRMISGIIIREALGVNLLGGVGGIIISGVLLVSFSGLVDQSLGGGFLVPSALTLALLSLGALASVGIVALVSSWIALRYVTTMDASLALKEGE